MPVMFIGHGSPMNAIAHNSFTKMLGALSQKVETPRAILVISAHWVTQKTLLTSNSQSKTIHDFGGFPKELYTIEYPAPGAPDVVKDIMAHKLGVPTEEWGLDHGTWSILRHFYPKANIPVMQMSIDHALSFQEHYELGKKISYLRDSGVLILGSGNIVHNLREIKWEETAPVFDWAQGFDERIKKISSPMMMKRLLIFRKLIPRFLIAPIPVRNILFRFFMYLEQKINLINTLHSMKVFKMLLFLCAQLCTSRGFGPLQNLPT